MKASFLSAFVALTSVSAHSIFQEVYVNGVDQGHINGIRVPSYDGPITDVTSNDLICNGGINPYQTPVSMDIISTPAGATVTAEWHHTLAGADPSDSQDPIDPSHHGPVMAYLAQVSNATQTTVTGLSWFKIWEDGFVASNQSWGVDRMIANKGKVSFTIPSCIPAGQYLLRVELIALHGAESYPGAQFYMECAQLSITGGGNTVPAGVSFPGAYKGTDPGITINIYQTLPSYTVPGPAVFSCSGNSPAPAPSSSSSTISSAPSSTSSSPASTTAPAPKSSSSSSAGTVAQYGQCGGTGWSGATTCVSPYTCTSLNAYYSQCL